MELDIMDSDLMLPYEVTYVHYYETKRAKKQILQVYSETE